MSRFRVPLVIMVVTVVAATAVRPGAGLPATQIVVVGSICAALGWVAAVASRGRRDLQDARRAVPLLWRAWLRQLVRVVVGLAVVAAVGWAMISTAAAGG